MLFDKVIVYDHLKEKINIVVNIKISDLINSYNKALNDIDDISNLINDLSLIPKQKRGCKYMSKVKNAFERVWVHNLIYYILHKNNK
jgi:anthranilate synthase component 1